MAAEMIGFEAGLTEAERELLGSRAVGGPVNLSGKSVRGHVVVDLINQLLTQSPPSEFGLHLSGGTIVGGLQLQWHATSLPLTFVDCKFVAPSDQPAVNLCGARLFAVTFRSCHFGAAVSAAGAQIETDFVLDDCQVEGAVLLPEASIGGCFNARGLLVEGQDVSIDADGLNVKRGINLENARLTGGVRLGSARIGTGIRCQRLEVNGGEPALFAERLSVDGDCEFDQAKFVGQVSCPRFEVKGSLSFRGARFFGSAMALYADGAQIKGACDFSKAMVIGLTRFNNARVGGALRFGGASLKVDEGLALVARGIVVAGTVELNNGFTTAGGVLLDGAEIKDTLSLVGSKIRSSLVTGGSRVARRSSGVVLDETVGTGVEQDAGIDQDHDTDVLALSLVYARIDHLQMPEAVDHRPVGIVDLSGAHVRSFQDYAAAWPDPFDARDLSDDGFDFDYVVLDGFVYDQLSNPSGAHHRKNKGAMAQAGVGDARVMWLAGQSIHDVRERFNPQPWSFLADRLAAQGFPADARQVSIAQKRFASSSWSASLGYRLQSWFLDVFALYGYSPWRALFWMIVFVLGFAALWGWAASHCALPGCKDQSVFVMTNQSAFAGERRLEKYPDFHPLAYSLDVFIPFADLGYVDRWQANLSWRPIGVVSVPGPLRMFISSGPSKVEAGAQSESGGALGTEGNVVVTMGGLLYALMVVEMILGMSFIVLVVAAFTGLLQRL